MLCTTCGIVNKGFSGLRSKATRINFSRSLKGEKHEIPC